MKLSLPKKFVFASLVIFFGLAALEGGLRLFSNPRVTVKIVGGKASWEEWPGFRWAFPRNKRFLYGPKDHQVEVITNSLGLRSPEISKKKPAQAFRILVLGDSSAMGHGVPERLCFARRLEKALNRRFPSRKVQVINGAVPGYSSFQALLQYQRLQPYKIDLVISYIQNSEGIYDTFRDSSFIPRTTMQKLGAWMAGWCYTFLTLRRGWRAVKKSDRKKKRKTVQRVTLGEFYRNMTRLADLTNKRDQQLLLLVPPLFKDLVQGRGPDNMVVEDKTHFKGLLHRKQWQVYAYRAVLRWMARRRKLPLLDVARYFQRFHNRREVKTYFLPHDGYHPSIRGHKVIARLLEDAFLRHSLIKRINKKPSKKRK